jgi:hypothetical protein
MQPQTRFLKVIPEKEYVLEDYKREARILFHNITNKICLRLEYEVVSESSQTVIVVTASVKEDGRGGQGHISKSHVTLHCEHSLFLYKCFLDFVFRFVCNRW